MSKTTKNQVSQTSSLTEAPVNALTIWQKRFTNAAGNNSEIKFLGNFLFPAIIAQLHESKLFKDMRFKLDETKCLKTGIKVDENKIHYTNQQSTLLIEFQAALTRTNWPQYNDLRDVLLKIMNEGAGTTGYCMTAHGALESQRFEIKSKKEGSNGITGNDNKGAYRDEDDNENTSVKDCIGAVEVTA